MVNKTSFIVINSSIVEYEFIIMSIHWEFIFDLLYMQKIPKPKKISIIGNNFVINFIIS